MKDKNKKTSVEPEKLTIYDYEQKYTRRENVRGAKILLKLIAAAIGVFLFFCMFSVTMKVFEINLYAGIGTAAVCVILYIFLFIVPLVKIVKTEYFIVNVNANTAHAAKKHNRQVRHNLADKIIDLTAKVEGVGWYDSYEVGKLAIAVKAGDEKGITASLSALYSGCVKKSAKELIFRSAAKTGMYSAISQTNKVDAMLVAFLNLQLVKDIVFLYGFRPSDTKLIKIFGRVLQNSLIAYGLGGMKIGNTIVQTMGNAVKGIPILGAAISTVVDSSVQGLTNGVLTAVIGFQTIKYLSHEYRLQEILDGIELEETQEEFEETCSMIEKELKSKKLSKAS
ncbi:MAG: YcjF family protein [Clostridia bacterium]|nr:YcjF family protein [Clostridia bacterium]